MSCVLEIGSFAITYDRKKERKEQNMTTLNVEGMMCEGCVKRVTEALHNLGLEPQVSLENKTVAFEGDGEVIAKAAEAIEDLGFDVVK